MSFESLEKVPRETSILCALEMKFYAFYDGEYFGSVWMACSLFYAVWMMIIWEGLWKINVRINMWKLREVGN